MSTLKRYNGTNWEYVGGNALPKTSKTTSNIDTYSCNYINNINDYSNTEQIVGTWYGETLYRKTLNIGTPNVQKANYPHNIQNFKQIIKAYGRCTRAASPYQQQIIPGNYTNWEIWLYDFVDSNFILYFSNNQWNAGVKDVYITLEYTKTSD